MTRAEKLLCCANHTEHPAGYTDHHEWAAQKTATHICLQCRECGRFAIWLTPRQYAAVLLDDHGTPFARKLQQALAKLTTSTKETTHD